MKKTCQVGNTCVKKINIKKQVEMEKKPSKCPPLVNTCFEHSTSCKKQTPRNKAEINRNCPVSDTWSSKLLVRKKDKCLNGNEKPFQVSARTEKIAKCLTLGQTIEI